MSVSNNSLKAKLEKLARDVTAAQTSVEEDYRRELDTFADTINATDLPLSMEVRPGSHPKRILLVARPRFRMRPESILLSFWLEEDTILVLGAQRQTCRTPEHLRDYLEDFVEHSAFPDTVAAYAEMATEPCTGFLRTISPSDSAPDDAMVDVPAEQQKKL